MHGPQSQPYLDSANGETPRAIVLPTATRLPSGGLLSGPVAHGLLVARERGDLMPAKASSIKLPAKCYGQPENLPKN